MIYEVPDEVVKAARALRLAELGATSAREIGDALAAWARSTGESELVVVAMEYDRLREEVGDVVG